MVFRPKRSAFFLLALFSMLVLGACRTEVPEEMLPTPIPQLSSEFFESVDEVAAVNEAEEAAAEETAAEEAAAEEAAAEEAAAEEAAAEEAAAEEAAAEEAAAEEAAAEEAAAEEAAAEEAARRRSCC